MTRAFRYVLGFVLCFHAGDAMAQAAAPAVKPTAAKIQPVYTVSKYDPQRNSAEDLAATIKRAKAERKRIILEVGGNWWSWCKLLDEFVHTNKPVATSLNQNYLIMKVNYGSKNRNEEFLKKYPKVPAYPHFLVLDSDGKFLHSQGTGELEEKKSYNEKIFLAFLTKWQPPRKKPAASPQSKRLNAEQVLAAGIQRAKAEKKKVLIHLGAPTWGWCRVLEKFLQKHHKVLNQDYVDIKIDTSEMEQGREVAAKLRKSRQGGIPWMVILDGSGKELISSDGPKGNCGYPLLPHEVEHFLKMLRSTSAKMTKSQLNELQKDLDAYREKRKKSQPSP